MGARRGSSRRSAGSALPGGGASGRAGGHRIGAADVGGCPLHDPVSTGPAAGAALNPPHWGGGGLRREHLRRPVRRRLRRLVQRRHRRRGLHRPPGRPGGGQPAAGRCWSSASGPGRLALPLAARGLEVHGIDASAAMLDRLRAKPGRRRIRRHRWATWPSSTSPTRRPFAVVFVAFNTFFNLGHRGRPAALPRPGGATCSPRAAASCSRRSCRPTSRRRGVDGAVAPRRITADEVVLTREPARPRRADDLRPAHPHHRGRDPAAAVAPPLRRPRAARRRWPRRPGCSSPGAQAGWDGEPVRPTTAASTSPRTAAVASGSCDRPPPRSEPAPPQPADGAVGHRRRRAGRPSGRPHLPAARRSRPTPTGACPFCPGNEEATPPALETYGPSGNWLVRVVPNLFPAFEGNEPLRVQNLGPVFTQAAASGVHEVLVFSPGPHRQLGRPRRQAGRPGHGRHPRPHGGPRPALHRALHPGHRQRRPRGRRLARPPPRPAARHPVRARRDRRGGSRVPALRAGPACCAPWSRPRRRPSHRVVHRRRAGRRGVPVLERRALRDAGGPPRPTRCTSSAPPPPTWWRWAGPPRRAAAAAVARGRRRLQPRVPHRPAPPRRAVPLARPRGARGSPASPASSRAPAC